MTFIINWADVPENVVDNFADEFSLNMSDEELTIAVDNLMKQFNAVVKCEDDVYKVIFESEAHYHWFILRYS